MSCLVTKIPILKVCCVFLLLFFPMSSSVPYPSSRCYKNDCSYQLTDSENNMCKIYNTSVCSDFYKFDESSEETLRLEEESKFHVSVIPYTAELFVNPVTVTRSAINITFTINNTDINELVVKIAAKVSSKPICRILDFRNIKNIKNLPINLFYDCLFNMVESRMQNVHMDFISLPKKEKLSYYVFIPGTKYPDSCTWQPLIMVFNGSLHDGVVQVKFSQAPESFNVSSYAVKLTHNLSGDEKVVDVTPDISRSMLYAKFSSVDKGAYFVSVKPVIWGVNDSCWSETDIFLIEKHKSDRVWIIYMCVFILLIFSAFVFLKMFRRNIAKLRFSSKQRILLLYSYDCSEHEDFVIAFINYLIKYCNVEVSTIYGDEYDPQEWIKKKYKECNIIMYLISEGLFLSLDSESSEKSLLRLQKGHEWRKQLSWATNFISRELLNNVEDIGMKKICQVCFPYSSKKFIPDSLQEGFGNCYDLPQEMDTLVNFMHYSRACFLCSKLCVTNFESSFEGTDLSEKMKVIQAAVKRNSHRQFVRPLNDITKNDLNSVDLLDKCENLDEISSISDASDENSDSYTIHFLSENLLESIPGECSVNLPSSSLSNIRPKLQNEHFIQPNKHKPVEDSDSDESNFYQPKLQSESEAKFVVENILNKNWT